MILLPYFLIVKNRRDPAEPQGEVGDSVIPLVGKCGAYLCPLKTRRGKVLGGQFYWGGTLLKSNAGAQRLAYYEWKP